MHNDSERSSGSQEGHNDKDQLGMGSSPPTSPPSAEAKSTLQAQAGKGKNARLTRSQNKVGQPQVVDTGKKPKGGHYELFLSIAEQNILFCVLFCTNHKGCRGLQWLIFANLGHVSRDFLL